MTNTFERVKEILDEKHLKQGQVAKALEIPPSTFSDWKSGRSVPKGEKLTKIANYLNVNASYLAGLTDVRAVRVPVLGSVAAGIPIEAIENVESYEELAFDSAKSGRYFGLRVKGDSMSPRIMEGDIVIVRVQEDAESGDVVIAKVNGNDATCKRLKKTDQGIFLISFNPEYEPMFYSWADILTTPVSIIGKVVESRSKF